MGLSQIRPELNRWFSRYVIAAMLMDENKRFLISSFCSSTSNCTLQHCYLCPWRLVANHLFLVTFSLPLTSSLLKLAIKCKWHQKATKGHDTEDKNKVIHWRRFDRISICYLLKETWSKLITLSFDFANKRNEAWNFLYRNRACGFQSLLTTLPAKTGSKNSQLRS